MGDLSSILIHCLGILVLTQLKQTFDLFDALWRHITSDSQQLRRLDFVSEQPIRPCQLENHVRFIWREISQEFQILDRKLKVGEYLNVPWTKKTLYLVSLHPNK